jgi:hypothetical protein
MVAFIVAVTAIEGEAADDDFAAIQFLRKVDGHKCTPCDCPEGGPKPGDEREVDYVPPPHGTPIRDWDVLLTQKEDPLVGPYGWVRFFNYSAELVQFTENKKGPSETILAVDAALHKVQKGKVRSVKPVSSSAIVMSCHTPFSEHAQAFIPRPYCHSMLPGSTASLVEVQFQNGHTETIPWMTHTMVMNGLRMTKSHAAERIVLLSSSLA